MSFGLSIGIISCSPPACRNGDDGSVSACGRRRGEGSDFGPGPPPMLIPDCLQIAIALQQKLN
jgi:hypothetical protein